MENERKGSPMVWIAAAVLAAGAGFYYYSRRSVGNLAVSSGPQAPVVPIAANPAPAAAPAAPPINLEESDAAIRDQVARWSLGPRSAGWLKADNLVRRIVAATAIVAEGDSPRESLSAMGPEKGFRVRRRQGRFYVDPAGYSRYDAVGEAFQSVDARAAADFLRRLMPLFEDACREMDCGAGGFQGAFSRAVRTILGVPVVEGDIRLRRKVLSYVMEDPALEGLNAAQKHLVRMGPKNTAEIQNKLREIARILGIVESDLPPTRVYTPRP